MGDCCTGSGGEGCDDPECEEIVCDEDGFCCNVTWDTLCAEQAAALCEICADEPPGPECGDGVCDDGESVGVLSGEEEAPRDNARDDGDYSTQNLKMILIDKRGNQRVQVESLGDLLRACGQNPTLSEIRDLEKNVGGDCMFFLPPASLLHPSSPRHHCQLQAPRFNTATLHSRKDKERS